MKCPNGCGELTIHLTGKTVYAVDFDDHEVDIGRISIMVCPKCGYRDEQTVRINI